MKKEKTNLFLFFIFLLGILIISYLEFGPLKVSKVKASPIAVLTQPLEPPAVFPGYYNFEDGPISLPSVLIFSIESLHEDPENTTEYQSVSNPSDPIDKIWLEILGQNTNYQAISDSENLVCGEDPCEVIESEKIMVRKPLTWSEMKWYFWYGNTDVKAILREWENQMADWFSGIDCEGDCEKDFLEIPSLEDATLRLDPVQVVPYTTCSNVGNVHSSAITGLANANGVTELDTCWNAIKNAQAIFKINLQNWLNSVCGEPMNTCGYKLKINDPLFNLNYNGGTCTVSIDADFEVECTHVAWNQDYWIFLEAEVCTNCRCPEDHHPDPPCGCCADDSVCACPADNPDCNDDEKECIGDTEPKCPNGLIPDEDCGCCPQGEPGCCINSCKENIDCPSGEKCEEGNCVPCENINCGEINDNNNNNEGEGQGNLDDDTPSEDNPGGKNDPQGENCIQVCTDYCGSPCNQEQYCPCCAWEEQCSL